MVGRMYCRVNFHSGWVEEATATGAGGYKLIVELTVNEKYRAVSHGGGDVLIEERDVKKTAFHFVKEYRDLVRADGAKNSALSMLSNTRVPSAFHDSVSSKMGVVWHSLDKIRGTCTIYKTLKLQCEIVLLKEDVLKFSYDDGVEEDIEWVLKENYKKKAKYEESGADPDDICPICHEEYSAARGAAALTCSHKFHENCITRWLQKSDSCPVCRCNFPGDVFICTV